MSWKGLGDVSLSWRPSIGYKLILSSLRPNLQICLVSHWQGRGERPSQSVKREWIKISEKKLVIGPKGIESDQHSSLFFFFLLIRGTMVWGRWMSEEWCLLSQRRLFAHSMNSWIDVARGALSLQARVLFFKIIF